MGKKKIHNEKNTKRKYIERERNKYKEKTIEKDEEKKFGWRKIVRKKKYKNNKDRKSTKKYVYK